MSDEDEKDHVVPRPANHELTGRDERNQRYQHGAKSWQWTGGKPKASEMIALQRGAVVSVKKTIIESLSRPVAELKAIMAHGGSTGLEASVASIILNSVKFGDAGRLETLLARALGKPNYGRMAEDAGELERKPFVMRVAPGSAELIVMGHKDVDPLEEERAQTETVSVEFRGRPTQDTSTQKSKNRRKDPLVND